MTASPRVWHYGLMAEYWSVFKTEAPEAAFFAARAKRYGQPVLDLGCGTGRVLLPLLRAGIDIDGCDISQDMIQLARQAATREGFTPNLYCQLMHELDLPRSYRLIYICGSFGLGGGRDNDLETLRRCHAHLEPGGALILNEQVEYASRDAWEQWLPESRSKMPEPWPGRGAPRVAKDGSQHFMQIRVLDVNALEQTYAREVRLEKWVADKLIVAEDYVLHGNMYLKPELMLMLAVAGFKEVVVRGDYTDNEATPQHGELVFIAIR
jgi:SAM-dependent methyltransferase